MSVSVALIKKVTSAPKTGFHQIPQFLQGVLHGRRAANHAIGKAIGVLEPDEFAAAEKRNGLQRFNAEADFRHRLLHVIRAGIDHF